MNINIKFISQMKLGKLFKVKSDFYPIFARYTVN